MQELNLAERLGRIATNVMSDVLDQFGLTCQVVSSRLRPLDSNARFSGVALCARRSPKIDTAKPIKSASKFEIENQMRPGVVAVIDVGGNADAGGMVGGFAAHMLMSKGCCGLVVNGAVRDATQIVAMGLPTFCVAPSPIAGTRRYEYLEVNVPVSLPGSIHGDVIINSGDLILGDFDGIVVLPAAHAEKIIQAAEKVVETETKIEAAIKSGMAREQALREYPRFGHIVPLG